MKKLIKFSKVSMLTAMAAVVMVMLPSNSGCPEVDPLDHTVLLPVPGRCGCYYSCSNGVPILMCCPDGLWFNDELDVCDWPQNTNCLPTGTLVTQKKTKSEENYKSTTPGWTFSTTINAWIVNGQVTASWPAEYRKITETTETTYPCCMRWETTQTCEGITCD